MQCQSFCFFNSQHRQSPSSPPTSASKLTRFTMRFTVSPRQQNIQGSSEPRPPAAPNAPTSNASASHTVPKASPIKPKPQYVPFYASRANVVSNVLVNSLYGLGLYWLYKDYQTAKKMPKDSQGTVTIVKDPPNRVFRKKQSAENERDGMLMQVFRTLNYGDLSIFAIGWGFLIQISNMTHVSFGKGSPLYRTSLLSVLAFPPFTFYMYSWRSKKLAQ